jgi:dolichyl-phosphate beta-glucosyltransferase
MKYVSLVIPAYNEEGRIRETVGEAHDYFSGREMPFEIIVSADGTDGTREAALDFARTHPEVRVIGSPERRGKGLGIREGVRIARGDCIGFSDADNKTPITEFDKIEPQLLAGADLVIGSRALRASTIERHQPLYRRWGSKAFGLFMHISVGLDDIVDTQCGFKFFRGDVAREIFALQQIDGYMFDVEILYLTQARGYRIAQVPIRWRDDGDSRWPVVSGSIRNGRDLLSIRWRHRSLDARPAAQRDATSRPPADV